MANITYTKTAQRHGFHLVDPSPWPLITATAAFSLTMSGVQYMHGYSGGGWILLMSFIAINLSAMYEDAKKRGQVGLNKSQLDPLVQQYFKTYCIPTNRSISEFMQLFS